jgi:glycine cleavage system aminomethyltransferase T
MLDVGIALAYVPSERASVGTSVTIDVRGRSRGAEVVKKPFYTREEKS